MTNLGNNGSVFQHRDVLEEYINLHGITLKIADTAGIRQTEDIVEKIGVSKAKEMAADADLILYVVDSSVPLDENDEEIIKILQEKDFPVLLKAPVCGVHW